MYAVRDLIAGQAPFPIDVRYNGTENADSTTKRYKGSLVKFQDFDRVTNGAFFTWAGDTTAMENIAGILEEEQPTSGNYLPNHATLGMTRRKMTPILPTTIIRAEYGQKDAAGTATTDTSGVASAASATFTITITTADYMIGGWIYFLTGSNAGYLHYILNNTTSAATFATAVVNAVVTADTFLVISPPQERLLDFDATYSGIKSEIDNGSRTDKVMGIEHLISAPGIRLQPLNRDKHDGLKIDNARFYHDFTIPSPAAGGNLWVMGPALA